MGSLLGLFTSASPQTHEQLQCKAQQLAFLFVMQVPYLSFVCEGIYFKDLLSQIDTLPARGLDKEPGLLPSLRPLCFRDLGQLQ